MLVLSRKANQGIWIGDKVYITILRIERGRVRLGIEAPADVLVDREEVRATHRDEVSVAEPRV